MVSRRRRFEYFTDYQVVLVGGPTLCTAGYIHINTTTICDTSQESLTSGQAGTESLCKAGYVLHYFQYKIVGHVLIFQYCCTAVLHTALLCCCASAAFVALLCSE